MLRAVSRIFIAISVMTGTTAAADTRVEVNGTEFRVTTPDGRLIAGEALIGAVLLLGDRDGDRKRIRIDAVERDPEDREIVLYSLSIPDGETWQNPCKSGPDGLALGFPLAGISSEAGEYRASRDAFSLTCTSGAIGKCVRAGYKPWDTAEDGTPLAPYLQACTRMIRADYCGDGISRTRDGTAVNVYDRLGIQGRDDAATMRFEAAWGPDGAVAMVQTRLPHLASVTDVVADCPGRLAGRAGPNWTANVAAELPEALIFNDSHASIND